MKSRVKPFDDIVRSNSCRVSQLASKLRQLTQNIDKDTFSGLTYLENSTEVNYLDSLVLSENDE